MHTTKYYRRPRRAVMASLVNRYVGPCAAPSPDTTASRLSSSVLEASTRQMKTNVIQRNRTPEISRGETEHRQRVGEEHADKNHRTQPIVSLMDCSITCQICTCTSKPHQSRSRAGRDSEIQYELCQSCRGQKKLGEKPSKQVPGAKDPLAAPTRFAGLAATASR